MEPPFLSRRSMPWRRVSRLDPTEEDRELELPPGDGDRVISMRNHDTARPRSG